MNEQLFVEKYAPKTISECILPDTLKKEMETIVQTNSMSNMLFIGDAGVGKTTVAKALCNELNLDYLFMNASNERGIDEVRNKIQTFASTTSLFGSYKVLILDEADNLTSDAQKALRALIEEYQNNCRFVMTCNYPYKILDPIRSRLQEFFFRFPASSKTYNNAFLKRLAEICEKEKIKIQKEDLKAIRELVELYSPNWRKILHSFQRCSADGKFNRKILYKLRQEHIQTLFEFMRQKNFTHVREWIAESFANGVGSTEVVDMIYRNMKDYLDPPSIPECVLILAEYQHKAATVANQEVNTVAMCVEIMMRLKILEAF